MREGTLKSLTGKYIANEKEVAYCHVDTVFIDKDAAIRNAIAAVVIKTKPGKKLGKIIRVFWETDDQGMHTITKTIDLMEVDLYGNAA